MKTKEFIEKVEELDFVGTAEKTTAGLIGFPNKNGEALISVNEELAYYFNTDYKAFRKLHLRDKRQLANIAWEYARTPLEEREEEKKYYVKLKNPILKELADDLDSLFVNRGISTNYFLADEDQENGYQTQFTQKEIDNFPDDVKEVLPLCKQIEVTP